MLWLREELETDPLRGRAAVVIDIIRATTSITTALAAGADRVLPVLTVEGARKAAARARGSLLCGERRGLPPPGFDLGNAPEEFERAKVAGRTLVFTTTNGTAAIEAARRMGAGSLSLACFRNVAAVARRLEVDQAARGRGIAIACAGRGGRVSMDDAWCAGHLVERLVRTGGEAELTDGARAAQALAARLGPPLASGLARTAAGQALRAIGRGGDLAVCAGLDDLEVVPVWRDGALVGSRGGEDA